MEFSFQLKVQATKEEIWPYYANIQNWYIWEDDLEDISLNGNFAEGTCGMMKLQGMPALHFKLTTVIENKAFCDKTVTPLGTVSFLHQILDEHGEIYIKHTVGIDAPDDSVDHIEFLTQIFSAVPASIIKLKAEVEK